MTHEDALKVFSKHGNVDYLHTDEEIDKFFNETLFMSLRPFEGVPQEILENILDALIIIAPEICKSIMRSTIKLLLMR